MSEFGFRMEEQPRERRRRVLPWLAAVLVLALMLGVGAWVGVRSMAPAGDFAGEGTGSVTVEVREGASVSQIAESLVAAGVIANAGSFVSAATTGGSSIAPGRYSMRLGMSPTSAYELMLEPTARSGSRLVIKEGTTVKEIVAEASSVSGVPASEFRAALSRPEAIGLPDEAGGNPQGWLFPATYDVAPGATATSILRQMTGRFQKAADDLDLQARATALGVTVEDLVIIASILEAEVAPMDYEKAARVIYNRLDRGMRLQMDSTVNFALGTSKLRLSATDLKVDSPYNTYLIDGLPPGPINSPGEAALASAANPAPGDWLYFVTTDPKARTTEFATTEAEFLRLKRKFQGAGS